MRRSSRIACLLHSRNTLTTIGRCLAFLHFSCAHSIYAFSSFNRWQRLEHERTQREEMQVSPSVGRVLQLCTRVLSHFARLVVTFLTYYMQLWNSLCSCISFEFFSRRERSFCLITVVPFLICCECLLQALCLFYDIKMLFVIFFNTLARLT